MNFGDPERRAPADSGAQNHSVRGYETRPFVVVREEGGSGAFAPFDRSRVEVVDPSKVKAR